MVASAGITGDVVGDEVWADKFFRGGQNKWIFIPVGYNLNTAWEMITLKFEEYLGKQAARG